MGSPLNQIHKIPLIQYVFLGFIGALSTLAFSPFNIKLVIPLTLAVLIYSVINSTNFAHSLKLAMSWGMGYWISGTGWLIVSIYYYGNTNIIISISIIILMGILLSGVFIAPFAAIKILKFKPNIFIHSLILSSCLVLLELARFMLLGGFPWLLPGLVFLDTFGEILIPNFGVYGASYIIYFFSSFLALSIANNKKNFLFAGLILLVIFLPYQSNQNETLEESLNLSIIQPSLDPFDKYKPGSDSSIEDVLINLTNQNKTKDLIIWPESPLPYLTSDPKMEKLIARIEEGPAVLSGSWKYKNNSLYNSMTILGTDQTYLKRHLVPFGEYVPFEEILRGLIDFFDMPMSSLSEGSSHQELLQFNDFKILGMICFDIAFPLSYLSEIRESDFIVNISNDTWFGSSYGPFQHLQIVRARALESNKWIARGTSDGISTIVDNKGTIVYNLKKGKSGFLNGKIYKTSKSSFFYSYGYLLTPILSFIVLINLLVLRLRV
ncbi:apolipoprotein N-acyltransferase [Gammaproteobacteria bacterium]|nr:apolipoprotein N-acyltransferase [Gammaproteobacteria bacterium]